MSTPSTRRRRLRPIVVPLLGLAVLSYFGYHAIHGERGLIAWWQLRQDIRVAEAERAAVAVERDILERRVALLKPGHPDPDVLDERARAMLNLIGPDELLILTPDE